MSESNGKHEPKNVSLIVLDTELQNEAVRWNLGRAGSPPGGCPTWNALGNDVAIETLTLTAETIERAAELASSG